MVSGIQLKLKVVLDIAIIPWIAAVKYLVKIQNAQMSFNPYHKISGNNQ